MIGLLTKCNLHGGFKAQFYTIYWQVYDKFRFWRPSWISQNPQGCKSCIIQIRIQRPQNRVKPSKNNWVDGKTRSSPISGFGTQIILVCVLVQTLKKKKKKIMVSFQSHGQCILRSLYEWNYLVWILESIRDYIDNIITSLLLVTLWMNWEKNYWR